MLSRPEGFRNLLVSQQRVNLSICVTDAAIVQVSAVLAAHAQAAFLLVLRLRIRLHA